MKKILGYLIGFLTLLATFAMLYFTGAIYDTYNRIKVEPFFLRDNTISRMGTPKNMSDVENKKLQSWLIQKFVTEYFYVIPDSDDIETRQSNGSVLYYLATPAVFREWKNNMVPTLTEMASKGVRQTVKVFDEITSLPNSNYLQVDYELKTWYNPNDIAEVPKTTRGMIYVSIGKYGDAGIKVKEPIEAVYKALLNGYDPAVVFVFKVESVKIPGNEI